jgi:RHS repeat-associated protein
MIRLFRCSYAFILLALTLGSASAQVPTGTPPLGTFGGGPDIIDLGNLNAHIDVPVVHKAGRGLNFTYDLSNDTSVWYPVGGTGSQSWTPVYNWGWRSITEAGVGYVLASVTVLRTCKNQSGGITGYEFEASQWTYHDPFGITHPFVGTLIYVNGGCGTAGPGFTNTTADGSGYTITVSGAASFTLYNALGTNVNAPYNTPVGAGSGTDRNGNEVSVTATGTFTDTLGTTALSVAGSGTPASPLTFTYTAPSGAAAPYTMSYKIYTVKTNFGCSGVAEYGPTSNSMVDRITLPDGTFYQFEYEATPSFTGDITGRLASVTLPTGGTISYTYTGGSSGHINCADGSASGFTRTTPDGTWTYTHVPGSGNLSTNTITDPQGNQTVYIFSGIYEISGQRFQGSSSGTLLETGVVCYNGNFSNCIGATVTAPITSKWAYRYFPNLANPGISATFYNTYGLLTEDREFDYVAASGGVPFLTDTTITYASLGNVNAFTQTTTTKDNNGNILSQVTNTYDQGTVTATSGTPQHAAISGSRGNLTTTSSLVQGSTTLNQTFTYFDTGNVLTANDVNGAATTYSYAGSSCGNSFATSVSEPLSLSRSFAWNCTGGVQTSMTDENSQATTTTYNDPYFWRPYSTTDPTGAVATFTYSGQNSTESVLSFNSGNSAVDQLTTLDGLGRVHLQQTGEAPGSSNFDSVETDYDSLGRPSRVTLPYVGTAAQTNSSAPATITTYDALSRPLQVTDAGGGSTTYSYPQNDVLVTVGPAPSGENTKRRQLEYDGLGRLTSVCEITGLLGNGTCGQNSAPPGAGYWTKYVYGPANLLTVTQNAQASSGSQQTRSYSYDGIGRLTSETNPESGTTTYSYDVIPSGCYAAGTSSAGDLTGRQDPAGDNDCFEYDVLHRVWSVGSRTGCKRFGYDNGNVIGSRPSGVTITNGLGRVVEAETDNCGAWPPTPITDEWFSYSNRGEVTTFWESTPHSGGYYAMAASYWANGVLNVLNADSGYTYAMTWNVDGEGRVYSTTAGGQNPLTSTVYNAASLTTQLNFGSGDNDQFTYDPNTYRMTQYKYNVNGQSVTGNLTWNPNWTLGSLTITDPFNSANAQTCNYSHDDLVRIASVNCQAATWQQNFTYDPFGNITKTVPVGGTGNSFQPTYSTSTNHITNISGFTPTYDANGDVTNDSNHTYTWDAFGNPITVDGVGITYDALDRAVEQNRGGSYTEITYSPTGFKMQLMNGTPAKTDFAPLPGGAMAVYSVTAPNQGFWYRHADWLGNSRLATNPNRTVLYDGAYAPFGEPYAPSGTTDLSFTGMNQDTSAGLYDFLYREYSTQGRWSEPDPGGLAAVNPAFPQSWNRYAYVQNSPLNFVDPTGLVCITDDSSQNFLDDDEALAPINNQKACQEAGGVWVVGSFGCYTYSGPGICVEPDPSEGQGGGGGGGGGKGGGTAGGSGFTKLTNIAAGVFKTVPCAAAAPLILSSWSNGGGSTSIGGNGSFTAAVPTGGIDANVSVMANGDAWGNASLTVTGGSNIPFGGLGALGAGFTAGGSISTSNGTVAQLNGQSLGGWVAAGPVSIQASRSANNGPISSGITVGGGFGGQGSAPNLFGTKTIASTSCLGSLINLAVDYIK